MGSYAYIYLSDVEGPMDSAGYDETLDAEAQSGLEGDAEEATFDENLDDDGSCEDCLAETSGTEDDDSGEDGDGAVFLKGFESKYYLPLFWLMLFKEEDCKSYTGELEIDDEDGEETVQEVEIPYLSAPLAKALATAQKRRSLLSQVLDADRLELYDYWLAKIGEESAPYVIVDLENLVSMLEPEDYAGFTEEIRLLLASMERATPEDFLSDPQLYGPTGLAASGGNCNQVSAFVLCGYSFEVNWPDEELEDRLKASAEQARLADIQTSAAEVNNAAQAKVETPWWRGLLKIFTGK